MKCPSCARDFPDTAMACGYCGHVLRTFVPPASTASESSAPRAGTPGWVWGLLAALGVLVIVAVVAVFLVPGLLRRPAAEPAFATQLPAPPMLPAAAPTVTPPSASQPTPMPPGGIVFEPWQEGVGTFLSGLAKGGGSQWTAEFPASTDVALNWAWCAKSQELLEQNLEHMQVRFFVDDVDVTNQFTSFQGDAEDWRCEFYRGKVKSWPVGQHVVYYKITLLEKINDGDQDYEGVISKTYTITVTP